MWNKHLTRSFVLQAVTISAVLFLLYVSSRYSFALMHTLVEMFSIIVACGIFMIAWNARRFITNNYILFLGIVFLFVGVLDLLHTLSHEGLNIFPGFGANPPNQLWIAARYMGSMSLVVAPLVIDRKPRPALLFWLCSAATALIVASIFVWRIFPDCYLEGVGFTTFKTASEYIVLFLFAASLLLLMRRHGEFERDVLILLAASILLRIGEELLFARQLDAYTKPNMLGHFLKVVSFYLFYKALIEAALKRPYEILFRNLKQSEEALRKERDRAQNYLDVAKTILVAVGADQRVTLINRRGCEILGYGEEEIVGRNWFDHFIPAGIREESRGAFDKLMAGAVVPVEYFENLVLTKSGEEKIIAWYNAVLRDEQGRAAATLSSGEDITVRRRTEEALARKTGELERSNAELDQFASIVSHDLREPLMTIGGFAQILRDRYGSALDAKGREHLDRIGTAIARMERLIADLLAFARVTTRGSDFGPVSLDRVVEMAVSNLEKSIDECGAVVSAGPLPPVMGDETQILELFQNLIGNAIKYRSDEPPRIHISAKPADDPAVRTAARIPKSGSKARWLFMISDNGLGIDRRHHETIFKVFERAHKGNYAGTGMGLAICRKIVNRHGGRIWVESEPRKGSTFYFTLP